MNRNPTDNMSKNLTSNRPNISTLNKNNSISKPKNNTPPKSLTSSYISPYKTMPTFQSTKNSFVLNTDRNISSPSTSTNNLTSPAAIKTPLPLSTSTSSSTDNTHTANTITSHTNRNVLINDQPIMNRTINPIPNIMNNINFASAVTMEKTPSREQALVFNSIDGIPQKEYILAIGKIVSPKNITFISRISNNRFCIFLSSKQILDNLMQTTQTISINEQTIQIRRLLNPAKRFII